jgi:hydroxyacylglutathione hydrolase
MKLVVLPAFSANYIWMLNDGSQAIVVDPEGSAPVVDTLQSQDLSLAGILVTHRRGDHVGGLRGLRSFSKGPGFGPAPLCSTRFDNGRTNPDDRPTD